MTFVASFVDKLVWTILYYTIPYHITPCDAMLYYTTLYNTIQYYTIPYYIILYYTILYDNSATTLPHDPTAFPQLPHISPKTHPQRRDPRFAVDRKSRFSCAMISGSIRLQFSRGFRR